MSRPSPSEVTRLLEKGRADESALERLLPHVYDELRDLAAAHLRGERGHHTLQPTALVHEAFVRLAADPAADWRGRAHFHAIAARAMRQVLVDHARRRKAAKRGGGAEREPLTLHDGLADAGAPELDVLDLHAALEDLARLQERKARVVELRFFGGLTFEETGHVLGISPRTVEADWYLARAWLRRELGRAGTED
jgi:RNA polymerase sigma-70 factor (ECF subfamily)